jgi:hypothetical protein
MGIEFTKTADDVPITQKVGSPPLLVQDELNKNRKDEEKKAIG